MTHVRSRPAGSGRDSRPGSRRRTRLLVALLLAACSIVLPGVAHLRARRRVTGWVLLAAYLVALAGAAYLVMYQRSLLIRLSVQPRWLTGAMYAAIALGLLWALLVGRSYRVLRPAGIGRRERLAGGLCALVLCAVACVPFAGVARYAYLQRHLVQHLFDQRGRPTAVPFAGKPRINVLLLGGDAGSDRWGTRTDSMTLASVDVRTGATVLISLPRNLQGFHFAPGPAATRFPNGFTSTAPGDQGLLNEVYQYGQNHPELVPGSRHPGADLLKSVFRQTLGVPVDYYVMVDMRHFADIVNAMGGVWLRVDRPIPYGMQGGVIQPGYRKLHGDQALWYGRSRTGSSDYVRMGRQKCVLAAIARQANPTTVLTKFSQLAATTEKTVSTDIPQNLLPALLQLSGKVRKAKISTLLFVPPRIEPGAPDWRKIRDETAKAIAGRPLSVHRRKPAHAPSVNEICPAPGPHG